VVSKTKHCCEFFNDEKKIASPFEKLISLGYYDGTVSGLAQCGGCEKVFHYRLVAWDESQNVRVFSLAQTKAEIFDKVVEVFSRFGRPRWPYWYPVLPAQEAKSISDRIDSLLASGDSPRYVIAAESPERAILAVRSIQESVRLPHSADFPKPSEWDYWKEYLHL
jgi:hypothetical protein